MKFTLNGLSKRTHWLRHYQLNRHNGSAYDKWVQMRAPKKLNSEEIQYLKGASRPKMHISEVRVEDDYILTASLEPHEVQLFEIFPRV